MKDCKEIAMEAVAKAKVDGVSTIEGSKAIVYISNVYETYAEAKLIYPYCSESNGVMGISKFTVIIDGKPTNAQLNAFADMVAEQIRSELEKEAEKRFAIEEWVEEKRKEALGLR